jgi:pimeloyl-ACP methyl ester carboxylesterase
MGHDASIPAKRAAKVRAPTLIMNGSESFPFMHAIATTLAQAIPDAKYRTLEGQTHEVESAALAPVLIEFFNG